MTQCSLSSVNVCMDPNVNIPENDPEMDREKRPWMYEHVFGGRLYKRKSGFFYRYDVMLCIINDALVDCMGDIMRLNKTYGPLVYSEFRRFLWSDENKFMFFINQMSARLFGAVVLSELINSIIFLVEHAM